MSWQRYTVFWDVAIIGRLVGELVEQAVGDRGLTGREFSVYTLLAVEGPLTPTALSRRSGIPPASMSRLVRQLEDRGHAIVQADTEDARSRSVSLTTTGAEALAKAQVGFNGLLRELHDVLGSDGLGQIRWSLYRLERGLRELLGEEYLAALRGPDGDDAVRTIAYVGPELSSEQRIEVERYVEWVRVRDGSG